MDADEINIKRKLHSGVLLCSFYESEKVGQFNRNSMTLAI